MQSQPLLPSLHQTRGCAFGLLLWALALLTATPVRAEEIIVAAPSSLTEVIKAVAAEFSASHGITITPVIAGTPQLAKQVEAGAPVDVFISADEQWMDWLDQRGLIDRSSKVAIAGNTLAIIGINTPLFEAPIDSKADILRALGDGRLAIGDPGSVPAGRYAKAAMTALGMWDDVKDRIALAENVRGVLELVRRGEARIGVVYATDVLAAKGVPMIGRFPNGSHRPIVYWAARINGRDSAPVRALLTELAGENARRHLDAAGFLPFCDGKPC